MEFMGKSCSSRFNEAPAFLRGKHDGGEYTVTRVVSFNEAPAFLRGKLGYVYWSTPAYRRFNEAPAFLRGKHYFAAACQAPDAKLQ